MYFYIFILFCRKNQPTDPYYFLARPLVLMDIPTYTGFGSRASAFIIFIILFIEISQNDKFTYVIDILVLFQMSAVQVKSRFYQKYYRYS